MSRQDVTLGAFFALKFQEFQLESPVKDPRPLILLAFSRQIMVTKDFNLKGRKTDEIFDFMVFQSLEGERPYEITSLIW